MLLRSVRGNADLISVFLEYRLQKRVCRPLSAEVKQ